MISKFLGISAGMALGAALLAAPASAATLTLVSDGTDVGQLDIFMTKCIFDTSSGSDTLAVQELACLNTILDPDISIDDTLKVEGPVNADGDLAFEPVAGGTGTEDIWALDFDSDFDGGYFSAKTGSLSDGNQYFVIFQNFDLTSFAVIDLFALNVALGDMGISMRDIFKISHFVVGGSVVPLPATALLFASALLGGGLMRRRKMIAKFGLQS